jgi:hypothetical protein
MTIIQNKFPVLPVNGADNWPSRVAAQVNGIQAPAPENEAACLSFLKSGCL